ncbi:carbohydrate ABC transporter permease [Cohnella hongkongensis]|uniref:Carbohydrate ABC transporter permease n=1 Tax=Cohnella hongkongensis TaxID=178337 RepID=A0ABV9FJ78_9BACL
MRKKKLSFEQRKRRLGVLFLLPWLIGFVLFFLAPLFQSLQFSFQELEPTRSGYELHFLGFDNFSKAVYVHPLFNQYLTRSISHMVVNVPLIIFFSLFAATLLNQRFRGRAVVRAIFFLPVILASGVIVSIQEASFMSEFMNQSTAGGVVEGSGGILRGIAFERMMLNSGVSPGIVDYLVGAVNRIYEIVSKSGVQILIFLAGLQSIPSTLYEASRMEGATGYEAFWKITFPMISPLIMTNVVYTIIDSFSHNDVTKLISDVAFINLDFGLSSAMSWIYFGTIALILAISSYLISKNVFYNE